MKFAQWKIRLIFLTLLIHSFAISYGYETHEFLETSPIYQIYDTKTYNDGTVLLHMINGNINNCSEPELYFRLIYPNGTTNSLNISASQIPRFNFCQILNNIAYQLYIKIWALKPNFIYATYVNSSDTYASVYGLLIDWNGKILSNSFISEATIQPDGSISPPGPLYHSERFSDDGFLYAGKQNTSDLIWSYYAFPATGIVEEVPALNITGAHDVHLKSLASGGYLFTVYYDRSDDRLIYGYVLNVMGNFESDWLLPQPLSITARGQAFDILPNNTLIAVTQYDNYNFSIITSGFPKYPIEGGVYLLRQTYPASAGFAKLSNDNKTLSISVFESTFNKPKSSYHIEIESDVVRLKDTSEPVLGIQNNVWNITTENRTVSPREVARESEIAFIRLSPEGTEKFNALDEKGKSNFTNNLGKELALIVPIEGGRITPLNRYQKDQRTQEKRIVIAYKIGSVNNTANNTDNENVEDILNDLQALISHSEFSLVSSLEYTKNLDSSYGFVRKRDIFRDNKVQLILFAVYIISLILLILMILYLNRNARIGVVLKFIFALVTFVFFVLYVYENAKDVESLALASVLLLIIPFVIKLSLGLYIMSRESKIDTSFHDWVNEHTMISFFFAFLSAVDLNAISVLSSEMEESLRAPLSESTNKLIDTIECVGFFLKDLLILAVLVLYYKLALDFGIVPFFALVSLIILIVYVIIWRFFRACAWCCRGNRVRDVSEEEEPSSSSSWWDKLKQRFGSSIAKYESTEELGDGDQEGDKTSKDFGSGASRVRSNVGSLFEKLGLGGLYRSFRSKHKHFNEGIEEDATSSSSQRIIYKNGDSGDAQRFTYKSTKIGDSESHIITERPEERVVKEVIEYVDEEGNPIDKGGREGFTEREIIEYVDEHGNPVDKDGNPISK
ncbi:hypothetical protein C1645_806410 [Glomus cerebriforme]|uniref:Lung seven transmembrane receptor-domain-containing protein n=1 Tax=Glomus cerebriforme TaxID=658196 RepID=A0A397SW03_9GLOM|nr:hypothetical protein C1645_806410 [Glomus cerebriforme]